MGDRASDLLLPPGFRFHPKDNEIITSYLLEKVVDPTFSAAVIGEADLNRSEPWDLPNLAKYGDDKWYFFSPKVRRYPTGSRINSATESGYWKATGKDKEIYMDNDGNGLLIGMKKTLVFYKGRAPKGEKTNWVMYEFRLDGNYKSLNQDWVVVLVKNKKTKKECYVDASRETTCLSISDYPNNFTEFPSFKGGTSSHEPLFDLEDIWAID